MAANETITAIISDVLKVSPEKMKQLSGDELLHNIGMDSINAVEIILQIEEAFDIGFDDEELLIENLNSINKLSRIVMLKQGHHQSA